MADWKQMKRNCARRSGWARMLILAGALALAANAAAQRAQARVVGHGMSSPT